HGSPNLTAQKDCGWTSHTERIGDEAPQLAPQPLANDRSGARLDHVVELVGVPLQVVKLVELARAAAVHPMDQLVAIGADRLVAHADEPRQRLLGPILDEDRLAPALALPREKPSQRTPLDLRTRLSAGKLDQRRRDVLADDQVANVRPGFHFGRETHEERRA